MERDAALLLPTLTRIAEALERLTPRPPAAIDWSQTLAAHWLVGSGGGVLAPLKTRTMRLDDLLGVERQKATLLANTRHFLAGLPANHALLWGARGTGKSSLVRALLHDCAGQGLRMVEVERSHLCDLPLIIAQLRDSTHRFIIYCDDLSFAEGDPAYKVLKSVLDGSLDSASEQVLIYATSNRRHLLPEYMDDNRAARMVGELLHESESSEEKISLSDRFGLWLSFYPFDQTQYLDCARHWCERLAAEHGLALQWNGEVEQAALLWSRSRGHRSGRAAEQFARDQVAGRLVAARLSLHKSG